jgi:hypothetical protein
MFDAEIALQDDWNSQEARERLNTAQATLQRLRQGQLEKRYDKIMASWTWIGDRCTKDFFQYYTGHRKPVIINKLVSKGRVLSHHQDMQAIVDGFYKRLYNQDQEEEEHIHAIRECLHNVQSCVTIEQNAILDALPTLVEIRAADRVLQARITSH